MGLTPRVTPRFKAAPTLKDGVRVDETEGRAPTRAKEIPKPEKDIPPPPPKPATSGSGVDTKIGGAEGHFEKLRKKHQTALDYAKQALEAEKRADGSHVEDDEETDVMKTWTSENQIERMTKPGSNYFNLDPFGVLMLRTDCTLQQVKKHFRKLSLMVHPDKNINNEKASVAFDAVKKAYQMVDTEAKFMEMAQVVTAAIQRVEAEEKENRKKIKKEGKPYVFPEPEQLEIAVQVMRTKLFGEMENRRRNIEAREADGNARAANQQAEEDGKRAKKRKAEKEWELTRNTRVASWRNFLGGKAGPGKKKVKPPKFFKPPSHEPEDRASVASAEKLEDDDRDDQRHKQQLRNQDHAAFKKNWR